MTRIPLRVPILNNGKKPSDLAHEATAKAAVDEIAKVKAIHSSVLRLLCECVRLSGGKVRVQKSSAALHNLTLTISDDPNSLDDLVLTVTEATPESKNEGLTDSAQ